jgi:hypothetical protein
VSILASLDVMELIVGASSASAALGAGFLICVIAAIAAIGRRSRRLRSLTRNVTERSFTSAFGRLLHVRGFVDGIPVRVSLRRIEVDVASPVHALLETGDVRAIAAGAPPDHALVFLGKPEAARAATDLLALAPGARLAVGRASTIVEDLGGAGDAAALARAAIALARSPALVQAANAFASCPFCKDAVSPGEAEGTVRCPTCGALHHADCWRDHGGCSIHGCPRGGPTRERFAVAAG